MKQIRQEIDQPLFSFDLDRRSHDERYRYTDRPANGEQRCGAIDGVDGNLNAARVHHMINLDRHMRFDTGKKSKISRLKFANGALIDAHQEFCIRRPSIMSELKGRVDEKGFYVAEAFDVIADFDSKLLKLSVLFLQIGHAYFQRRTRMNASLKCLGCCFFILDE